MKEVAMSQYRERKQTTIRVGSFRAEGSGTAVLVMFCVYWVVGTLCTSYTLDFWLTFFQKSPVIIPLWACAIAAIFIGGPMVPLAVLTWFISFGVTLPK
jgi:hypothetical protein